MLVKCRKSYLEICLLLVYVPNWLSTLPPGVRQLDIKTGAGGCLLLPGNSLYTIS